MPHRINSLLSGVSRTALGAAFSLTLLIAPAAAGEPKTFNIPVQEATTAIRVFGQQAGVQVLATVDDLRGKRVNAVVGKLDVQDALRQMLIGTGLTFRSTDSNTILIEKPRAASNDAPATPVQAPASDQSGDSSDQVKSSEDETKGEDRRVEKVVVTGTNIRGLKKRTVPVKVLDRDYIDSTGAGTTTEVIERLPQNFALASQSGVSVQGVSNASFQGSNVNLRGIGQGTTLVLLNGRRMPLGFLGEAVDISALPLAAIDRVEILLDGASALYGSDAIGGVVNFVMRSDYDGAQTRLRAGRAEGGVDEYRAEQVVGSDWETGNALVSVGYYKRDLLRARERDFVPSTSRIGSLFPEDENFSVFFAGRQDLTDTLSLFADGLYTTRDSYNEAGNRLVNTNLYLDNPQGMATVGLDWQLSDDWQLEVFGGYGRNKANAIGHTNTSYSLQYVDFESWSATAKADGPIFTLPGGTALMAVGAEWRSESFKNSSSSNSAPIPSWKNGDQIVRSVFAEMHVPLVGSENAFIGMQRLELSVAGRFDDYSEVGSSVDPTYGLLWEPIGGLRFRGSYGTSFKTPRLRDYSPNTNGATAQYDPDPASPSGLSHTLIVLGSAFDELFPQHSENSSFGVDFSPEAIKGLHVGLNYYQIRYSDQIAFPPQNPTVLLSNPSAYGSLVIRDPSVAQVNEFIAIGSLGTQPFIAFDPDFNDDLSFDPSTIDAIVDLRRRNLSVAKTRGLDFSFAYEFELAESKLHFGLDATHILELEQQVTAGSSPFSTVDTYNNPPDWRGRASLGWQSEGWSANVFVNYTDSYTDNRLATLQQVSSYTTADARLAYDFDDSGMLSGFTLSISAQNLLDKDPPRTAITSLARDMGFDPTNANPMGRFLAVEVTKDW